MAEEGSGDAPTTTDDTLPKPPTSGGSKVAMQMNKLKEANNKYKSLLKMAKERITTQEEEMEALKGMLIVVVVKGGIECPVVYRMFYGI